MTQSKSQLLQIKDAAVTQGNSVKSQILTTVNSFQGQTSSMRELVVGQVTEIKAKYQEPAKTYDGYRSGSSAAAALRE